MCFLVKRLAFVWKPVFKVQKVYSLFFHFLQLFEGWDQIRLNYVIFFLNYFVSCLLIYFAIVFNQ